MLTNHCMYLQWYLELLSASCGFNSRREQPFFAVMIDQNHCCKFVFRDDFGWQIATRFCCKVRNLPPKIRVCHLSLFLKLPPKGINYSVERDLGCKSEIRWEENDNNTFLLGKFQA